MSTIHVATTGNDGTGDGSSGTPFATIAHASTVASPGDEVLVAAGTYGPVDMTTCNSGSSGSPIVFRSATKWGALIVSGGSDAGWVIGDQGATGPSFLEVRDFDITAPGSHYGILVDGSDIRIAGNHVHHVNNSGSIAGAGINLEGFYGTPSGSYQGTNLVADGNVVHAIGNSGNNLCHPIYVDSPNGTVSNNIIYDTGGYGVHCYHAGNNPTVVNNLLFGIPNNAAILAGGGPEVTTTLAYVGNNIIIDCTKGIAEVDSATGAATIQYRNNRFWNVGTEYDTYTSGNRSGDTTGDPLLVNYQSDGSGDYHLAPSSPCRGAGATAHLPALDLDGVSRGGVADVGPYAGSPVETTTGLAIPVTLAGALAQPPFTSWTADLSQRFLVPVTLQAVLEAEPGIAPGTHLVPITRHSITMPTPSLGDYGIPDDTFIPTDSVSDWGRLRILFEGHDLTFLRGVPTLVKSWGSHEPGGDNAAIIEFPQVSPFEHLGVGDRTYIKDGSRVYINLIRGDLSQLRLFSGEVVSPETSEDEQSAGLTVHVQGILFTADNSVTPPSFHQEERDIGTAIAETLNGYQAKKYAPVATVHTGITTRARGAWTPRLSGHVADLLGTATTADGSSQWTLDNLRMLPKLVLKDRTTVHATVTVGTPGLSFDLASDRSGAPNVIYGEGTAPDGGHWRNTKYPNLRHDSSPLYPLAPGSTFSAGDADTGFDAFADEMRRNGYTMHSGDTYVAADIDEVRDAQTRAGITVDGIVGPQTWAAVFEVGSNAGDLSGAHFAPLAFKTSVMPRKYNAQGADIGPNPGYDRTTLRVERFENYGEGITKQQAVQSARAELARVASPGVQGTITLKIDPQERSRFELRAGMNIRLKSYQGANVLFHIAGAEIDWAGQTVALEVDTHARDLLTLAAIRSRNADAATDPVRRNLPQRRASRQVRDNTVVFDAESGAGIVPRLALFHGLWTVVRIPAGQLGSIARSVFTTDSPAAPFAVGVFSKVVTANALRRLVGNPLGASIPWSPEADALNTAGLLMAWGSTDEPAGYYPANKTDGGSVTGRLVDDATWYYESQLPPWLWVALYSSSSCFISGRLYAAPDGG